MQALRPTSCKTEYNEKMTIVQLSYSYNASASLLGLAEIINSQPAAASTGIVSFPLTIGNVACGCTPSIAGATALAPLVAIPSADRSTCIDTVQLVVAQLATTSRVAFP